MYIRLCYQTKLQHPSTETTESVLRCVGYRSKRNPEGLAGAFWILDPKEDLLGRTVVRLCLVRGRLPPVSHVMIIKFYTVYVPNLKNKVRIFRIIEHMLSWFITVTSWNFVNRKLSPYLGHRILVIHHWWTSGDSVGMANGRCLL